MLPWEPEKACYPPKKRDILVFSHCKNELHKLKEFNGLTVSLNGGVHLFSAFYLLHWRGSSHVTLHNPELH